MRRLHYSGKVASNSQLHLGVFLDGVLEGAMQFGPSLDKRRMMGLVRDTAWNGFLELNRLAFSDALPRNSESRALSIALRMIRRHYPHVEWIVSFADGTQCGDGTIYRAAGFVLTSIKKNTTIWAKADGATVNRTTVTKSRTIINRMSVTEARSQAQAQAQALKSIGCDVDGASSMERFRDAGFAPLPGFQLRYVYFLNADARARLTVPGLPFSKIAEMGAAMYLGVARGKDQAAGHPPALGGETPTPALQPNKKPRAEARG